MYEIVSGITAATGAAIIFAFALVISEVMVGFVSGYWGVILIAFALAALLLCVSAMALWFWR